MSDLLLTSDKVDFNKFKEKYPTNILNISSNDIFKKSKIEENSDVQSYNQMNLYEIYDSDNYNESLDKYEKLREKTINVSMDEYNKMFEMNKKKLEQKIIDLSGQVSITPDPYRTKYRDTYSITPYATNLLTPLSGDDIDNVVSRFDDCVGVWSDGYYDKRNSKWHDSKEKHCYKNGIFDPCQKYTKYYRILNKDYTGKSCKHDDKDTKKVKCDKEMCKNNIKPKYKKK